MKRILTCAFLILCASCGRKVQITEAPPPVFPGPPEYEVAYQEGLKSFRLATPEGYQRAAASFQRAADLETTNCAYPLRLAESLYFLAQEQKQNWEPFESTVSRANTVLEFKEGTRVCDGYDSYIVRLRTLSGTFTGARTAASVALITQAIEDDPDDPMNWLVLAQLRTAPLPGQSIAPVLRAAERAPDLPIVQYPLGNYYLNSRVDPKTDLDNARKAFDRVLEQSPRHFLAMIGKVYSLSAEGDDAAADVESLLKKAAEIAPTSLKVRTVFGDYYSGLEETQKAAEQYKAATDFNPRYYPGFLGAGVAWATADNNDQAEAAFNAVIALEVTRPQPPFNTSDVGADAQSHYYLGNIWLERNALVKARAEFNAALKDLPSYDLALYGLGIVSYQERKLDEALGELNQVIKSGGRQYPNAFLVRGGIYADRRQFTESLNDLSTAIQIYKEQSVALAAKAEADDARGFKRRAEGERRRKARIDGTLQKAEETKTTVESLRGPGGMIQ
jgi:tetratricopeptide (TPR) repeat protein